MKADGGIYPYWCDKQDGSPGMFGQGTRTKISGSHFTTYCIGNYERCARYAIGLKWNDRVR
jgi:hypothetical protein